MTNSEGTPLRQLAGALPKVRSHPKANDWDKPCKVSGLQLPALTHLSEPEAAWWADRTETELASQRALRGTTIGALLGAGVGCSTSAILIASSDSGGPADRLFAVALIGALSVVLIAGLLTLVSTPHGSQALQNRWQMYRACVREHQVPAPAAPNPHVPCTPPTRKRRWRRRIQP